MELKTETQQESCRFQSSLETDSGGGHHSGALGESGCAESALSGSADAGVPGAGQGSCRGRFAESAAQGVAPYKAGGIATPQDSKGILDQGLQEVRGETQSRVPA